MAAGRMSHIETGENPGAHERIPGDEGTARAITRRNSMSEVMQKQWTPEEYQREQLRSDILTALEDEQFVQEIKARLQRSD